MIRLMLLNIFKSPCICFYASSWCSISEISLLNTHKRFFGPTCTLLSSSAGKILVINHITLGWIYHGSESPFFFLVLSTEISFSSKQVPPGLDTKNRVDGVQTFSTDSLHHGRQSSEEAEKSKKLLRRPSKKVLANGVIFLGGILYLTRGNPAVGAKVAMAYILTKLSKRGRSSSCQSLQQQWSYKSFLLSPGLIPLNCWDLISWRSNCQREFLELIRSVK